MIDHLALKVSDFKRSQLFYDKILLTLGYKRLMKFAQNNGEGEVIFGWGDSLETDFWISQGRSIIPKLHIAFRADTREQVDEFYQAAIAAGGRDNGKPGLRTKYHEHYYATFVLDPDDHNIEAVCHVSPQ